MKNLLHPTIKKISIDYNGMPLIDIRSKYNILYIVYEIYEK